MDNFKGQIISKVADLLEQSNIHTYLLPPNTTDRLQPLDLAVIKPAKEILRQKFIDNNETEDSEDLDTCDEGDDSLINQSAYLAQYYAPELQKMSLNC